MADVIAQDSQHFVAIDMGSNSFHLVIAREQDGLLQVLHKEKRQVQLAKYLDNHNVLAEVAIENGVQCLKDFSQRFSNLAKAQVKIVATHTLRVAKNRQSFLTAARKVLPYPINVVSGHEEARLIYTGIAHSQVLEQKNIVIDIGGGSTEVIVGNEKRAKHLASLKCGCVSYNKRFFVNGHLTKEAFKQAIQAADKQFSGLSQVYFNQDWSLVLGSSGSAKAITLAISEVTDNGKGITSKNLLALKKHLINVGSIDKLEFELLDERRIPLLAAGLAILISFFRQLGIEHLQAAKGALREGVLYELAKIEQQDDIRQRTLSSLAQLYHADVNQASKVTKTALTLFEQVSNSWQLADYRWLLEGACQLHEIGISINSKSHHKHGSYILENSDLPGFNQQQQQMLALLVGNHRKKLNYPAMTIADEIQRQAFTRLLTLLRLAVLFNLGRTSSSNQQIKVKAQQADLTIKFSQRKEQDKEAIQRSELLIQDLYAEQKKLATIGINLSFK
ncbi:Ppx/GppA phosphatase family protein [Shewanella sp. UCD-FRSSP16_17]|uniref:Ppx/GppA phosphatase family protein n=1 Tax=Shewanella sp. UCD-FRSSP16_17 TaxID=1853256 RepID=UPI000B2B1956|nr:Ppx/GppA phosphatase family protein [Shewanella sp. UCD-FRSSP16_17]